MHKEQVSSHIALRPLRSKETSPSKMDTQVLQYPICKISLIFTLSIERRSISTDWEELMKKIPKERSKHWTCEPNSELAEDRLKMMYDLLSHRLHNELGRWSRTLPEQLCLCGTGIKNALLCAQTQRVCLTFAYRHTVDKVWSTVCWMFF